MYPNFFDTPIFQPVQNYGKCQLESHNNPNNQWGNYGYTQGNSQGHSHSNSPNHQQGLTNCWSDNQAPTWLNQNEVLPNFHQNTYLNQPMYQGKMGNQHPNNFFDNIGHNNIQAHNLYANNNGWGQQFPPIQSHSHSHQQPQSHSHSHEASLNHNMDHKPSIKNQPNLNNLDHKPSINNQPNQVPLDSNGWPIKFWEGNSQETKNIQPQKKITPQVVNNNKGWEEKKQEIKIPNNQIGKSVMQIKKKNDFNQLNIGKNEWVDQQKKLQKSKIISPGQNTQNLLDEQVIYLEPSKNKEHLEDLKRKGLVFEDPDFPHNEKSMSGDWGYVAEWKGFVWKRISDIMKGAVIFDGKIQPKDIKQGYLGDCYFLAALAALAERPERIFNLFLETQQNPQKYYAVKILYKGKWKTIQLDEWIPSYYDQPAFSKSVGPSINVCGKEIWVMLLEKAWAKLFGSYKNIQSGFGEEGLHDLTGAHMHTLRFQSKDFDVEASWKYLLEASQLGYCMIGSTQPGSDRNTSVSGIVLGHAYTLLKAVLLNYKGNQVRLVQLRNPWGKTQAKTAWNDNDPKWNQVSSQQKARIGYEKNDNDGIFFQLFDDFIKDFRVLNIAEVNDNASYVYLTQRSSPRKGNYFKVKIHRQGNYSFQLNQTPERSFNKAIQKQYKYSNLTLLIGKINGNQIEYFEGSQSAYRTNFKKHKLTPGDYIVFAKIFFNTKLEKDFECTLAVYGESVCDISVCPPNESKDFKEKMYLNKAQKNGGKQIKTGVFYLHQILKEGYIYIAAWNNSQENTKFNVIIVENPNPTVILKKPYKGEKNKIEVNIAPGGSKVILARVPDFGYTTGGIGTVQFVNIRKV